MPIWMPDTNGGGSNTGNMIIPPRVKPKVNVSIPTKAELTSQLKAAQEKLDWINKYSKTVFIYDTALSTPYRGVRYVAYDKDKKVKSFAFTGYEMQLPWRSGFPYFNLFDSRIPCFTQDRRNKIISELKAQITTLNNRIAATNPAPPRGDYKSEAKAPKDKKETQKPGGFYYNVPAVKDAYFSEARRNTPTLMGSDGNQTKGGINNPYLDLWNGATNHKGMITSWTNSSANKGTSTKNLSGSSNFKQDKNRYGFQFQYNPQPITMSYSGAPAVDIANFMSGQEEYALYTGGNGAGNISFDLILNRIDDMKYYKDGILTSPGVYPGRDPYGTKDAESKALFDEQKFIYDKGTMYDIEYLLRTVMGVTMESQYRGKTADFGWIGAMPVEVHLSPGLRYWATMSAFTVNHVMFNERMVPIFSTVRVSLNRLPDYTVANKKEELTAAQKQLAKDKKNPGYYVHG